MPIREIFYLIKENKGNLTKEELKQMLRERGYAEDEIEEAFLWAESEGSVEFKSRKPVPTLWQSLLEGTKRGKKEKHAVEEKYAREITDSRGSFIIGTLIAPTIYFVEILIITFLQLFYPIPEIDPLIPIGAAAVIGMFLYLIFRPYAENFYRGTLYGVGALLVWFIINLINLFLKMRF